MTNKPDYPRFGQTIMNYTLIGFAVGLTITLIVLGSVILVRGQFQLSELWIKLFSILILFFTIAGLRYGFSNYSDDLKSYIDWRNKN